jgi:inositol 1,4,5-triphosphate receptor type 1/inositol 1,4,5-triphosphate receptor type 3
MKSGTCWPLKRNIRCFINRLYYFRPEIDTQLKNILSYEVPNIIDDLNLFIGEKYSPDCAALENKKFKNPVRFTYIESYHYLLIEETLFTIYQLVGFEKLTR